MKNFSAKLFLEINELSYIFYVGEVNENNNLRVISELEIPASIDEDNRISNLENTFKVIKENIYSIEQKLNYTFKEVILILDNFNPSFISLTGFKKLNSSQVSRENITYILNILKSRINEIEIKKTVLHIFNSKFYLDNKEIENLPIGLFGDFYSHELSFTLVNTNDYKNLKNIFDKCSLNIKKILVKSFVKGVNISENHKNSNTFFHIKINEKNSKIFYFENNCLKSEQKFKFGTDIIIRDISKITALKTDTVKNILNKIELTENISEDELVEKNLFINNDYRKIKKKLIYEIILARVKEIFELILFKNINFKYYRLISKNIFIEIDQKREFKCFREIYKITFSTNSNFNLKFLEGLASESILNSINKLAHFGWKKEAIPVAQPKKSLLARFFEAIFN